MIIDRDKYRNSPAINQSILKTIENPSLFLNLKNKEYSEGKESYFKNGTFIDALLDGDKKLISNYVKENPSIKTTESFQLFFDKVVEYYRTYKLKYANEKEIVNFFNPKSKCFLTERILEIHDLAKNVTIDGKKGFRQHLKFDTFKKQILAEKGYFKFLTENINKTIISSTTFDIANNAYDYIKSNIEIAPKDCVWAEEYEYRKKVCLTGIYLGVEIKGELDRLLINHKNKTFSVIDIKTTADSYNNFLSSILKYRYDFQLSFYQLLVNLNLKELGIEGYLPDRNYFWIIDSLYKLPVKKKLCDINAMKSYTISSRKYIGVEEALTAYMWHIKNNKWDFKYNYYENMAEEEPVYNLNYL